MQCIFILQKKKKKKYPLSLSIPQGVKQNFVLNLIITLLIISILIVLMMIVSKNNDSNEDDMSVSSSFISDDNDNVFCFMWNQTFSTIVI